MNNDDPSSPSGSPKTTLSPEVSGQYSWDEVYEKYARRFVLFMVFVIKKRFGRETASKRVIAGSKGTL